MKTQPAAAHPRTHVPRRSGLNRDESLLIALLFGGGLINYMDRTVFGILAPLIRKDLGLDPGQLGLALGLFAIGYALFAFVGGWASDRFGAKTVLAVSMTVWSILCGLTGATMGLASLLVVRFFFGMAESPWVPSMSKMLSRWFSRERYAAAIGIAGAGQPLGGAVAGPVVGLTVVLIGWRYSFAAVAAVGIAWALIWLALAKNAPPDAAAAGAASPLQTPETPPRRFSREIGYLVRQPTIIATAFSFAASNYVVTFFFTWFPSYLTSERGVTQLTMSMVTAFPWALATLGQIGGGFLSDYMSRRSKQTLTGRKIILVVCLVSAGICVTLTPHMGSVHGVVIMMAAAIGSLFLSGPNYYAVVNELVEADNFGGAIGLVVACVTCAGILSPVVTGYIIQATSDYRNAFMLAGLVSIMGAAVFAIFARPDIRERPSP